MKCTKCIKDYEADKSSANDTRYFCSHSCEEEFWNRVHGIDMCPELDYDEKQDFPFNT